MVAAGKARLPDDLFNAVMLFEPSAVEIAMAELRRVLRAEARHASKMRKRAGELPVSDHTHLAVMPCVQHSLISAIYSTGFYFVI